ncbi:MAG: SUMF1/EgtB/PvdO family nonheme iron enzyme [Desulfuromusa sp.]|nr:SUMF1/EgtB/PvdO family nonheme iron enzyme [Desulfuromusa sp.]
MRITYLLVCFTLLLSFVPGIEAAHAVPKMVKAKSEYLLAEKLLNQGNHSGAIEHALKSKTLLGKSNSRIEYLLTKAYNAQGKYAKALAALEEFFAVTPESSSGSDEYNEMVSLYSELEILTQEQRKRLETEKNEKKTKKKALQEALAEVSRQIVAVPGGCFKVGNHTLFSGDDDERPRHKVCLDNFSIGKYEVTQALWVAVMGNNPSETLGGTIPVTMVSWEDVQQFIHKINSETGKNYRLPTEAEWMYAARSGGKKEKYSGGNDLDKVGWYGGNADGTIHPVGQKAANGLGLHDMTGNVWEWCQDWYGAEYYMISRVNNPTGPSAGNYRVKHGGSSVNNDKDFLRVGKRVNGLPSSKKTSSGFRLVHP